MDKRRHSNAAEILKYLTDIHTDDSDAGSTDIDTSDEEEYVETGRVDDCFDMVQYEESDNEQVDKEDDEVTDEDIDEDLIDCSAKDQTRWIIFEDGGEKRTRNRIKFNETSGPTRYVINKVLDESALSVFRLIIDNVMLDNIVIYTNENIAFLQPETNFKISRNDLLAFIAVQFSRGLYCSGVATRRLWSNFTGIPIIRELMSRN